MQGVAAAAGASTWGPMAMETSQGCAGGRLALPSRLVLATPCSSCHRTPPWITTNNYAVGV